MQMRRDYGPLATEANFGDRQLQPYVPTPPKQSGLVTVLQKLLGGGEDLNAQAQAFEQDAQFADLNNAKFLNRMALAGQNFNSAVDVLPAAIRQDPALRNLMQAHDPTKFQTATEAEGAVKRFIDILGGYQKAATTLEGMNFGRNLPSIGQTGVLPTNTPNPNPLPSNTPTPTNGVSTDNTGGTTLHTSASAGYTPLSEPVQYTKPTLPAPQALTLEDLKRYYNLSPSELSSMINASTTASKAPPQIEKTKAQTNEIKILLPPKKKKIEAQIKGINAATETNNALRQPKVRLTNAQANAANASAGASSASAAKTRVSIGEGLNLMPEDRATLSRSGGKDLAEHPIPHYPKGTNFKGSVRGPNGTLLLPNGRIVRPSGYVGGSSLTPKSSASNFMTQ